MRPVAVRTPLLLAGACVGLLVGAPPLGAQEVAVPEAEALGRRLEETVSAGDGRLLDEVLDDEKFLALVVRGVDAPRDFVAGFYRGARRKLTSFGQGIAAQLHQQNGRYHFLAFHSEERRLLFRVLSDEGVNYHELHLVSDGGRLRVVDFFMHQLGERLSAMMRRSFLMGLASTAEGGPAADRKLQGLMRLTAAVREGRHAEALSIYRELPADFQADRSVLQLRLQAAGELGDAEYRAALTSYAEHHPDASSLHLLLIDRGILDGDFESSLRSVDAVEAAVGQDPYLDILRSSILLLADQPVRARERLATARADPRLAGDVAFAELDVAVALRDHPATAALLTRLEEEHGVVWEDLTEHEAFAEFVTSAEYRTWRERKR